MSGAESATAPNRREAAAADVLPSPPGERPLWHVGALTDLVDESPVRVDVEGVPVCLVRVGGRVFALRDECSHQSVPLSAGEVDNSAIECWLHGSRFDLETGAALNPPAVRAVPVFPVLVTDDGQVYVSVGAREPAVAARRRRELWSS